ncbi:ROK family protein [Mollicutes bacterium LVI A0078]|nr:ROK family protein [Mollicutes bacterium LVI A0075]WOO91615.1 ROK family protein [Mollicutes bacterium LVI A0078]
MSNILVIDIGGSSVKCATFTKEGKIESKTSFDVPASFELMKAEIKNLFNSGDYSAISISSPGSIDTVTGKGYGLSAIDYIPCGGNLKQELSEELNVPVAIENDANCAGLSEVHFSNGLNSIAYIVLGSGVGGCMIVDGKVVTGSTFFGGEFGYMPYKDSTFSHYGGMVGLSKRATKSEEIIPGTKIFAKYDLGEADYVSAVNEYYTAIAHLITILKYTQNPEAIIFAGAVTNRETFLQEVKVKMDEISNSPIDSNVDDVNIQIGQFGSDANLYGAYANLVRNYKI